MARIETLLSDITDSALRAELEAEVRELKKRIDFGLVFERHAPESVLLAADVGVKVGDKVRIRTEPDQDAGLHAVEVRGDEVLVENGEGEGRAIPLSDALVVRGFTDAVFPGLEPMGSIEQVDGRSPHLVIEGENYHALELLSWTHASKADCIYIDPPYNTGARDWKYNNDYVDATDGWRHSKWLAFMERRLRLARQLLRPDGVLIVTIDENEVHHLALLLAQVFPEYLRYMVNIVINPKGTNKANFGRVEEHAFFVVPNLDGDVIAHLPPPDEVPDTELAAEPEDRVGDDVGIWVRDVAPGGRGVRMPAGLYERLGISDDAAVDAEFVLNADGAVEMRLIVEEEHDDKDGDGDGAAAGDDMSVLFLRRRGAQSSFRTQRPNQFYAIKVNEKTRTVVGVGPLLDKSDDYELGQHEGEVLWVYPIDADGNERVWRYKRETMEDYIAAGQIVVGTRWDDKPQTYTLNHQKPREGERVQRLRTTWWRPSHDAGTHGTTMVSRLLGKPSPFSFPKSLYAVRDALEAVVRDRPDALIIDFFAGSGTTLHATALLNEADGGRRRCILVTNNEVDEKTAKALHKGGHYRGDPEFEKHGIFQAATRPRLIAALTGTREDGSEIPSGKAYRYINGRPWNEGFGENAVFLRLAYLDENHVEIGAEMDALTPVLWARAGATGPLPSSIPAGSGFHVEVGGGYAVLAKEDALTALVEELNEHPDVTDVFLATPSRDAFAEMSGALRGRDTHMIPRDFLRHFRDLARRRL